VPEPIRVTAAAVTSQSLPTSLEVTGALAADASADVAAEHEGRVAEVRVERGSFVEKGAVLATLDTTDAKASLDEARAQVVWAEAEQQRYTELRQKGVVAPSERQRKDIDTDMARARLARAQKAFEDCVIRAPFSGLVTEKKISAGAFVSRGQAVAGLVKVDPLRAVLSIPESGVGAVKVGQTVRISVQTFPGRTFDGRIAYVGPSLRSDARSLVVEAIVPNRERLLLPGLFASASVELPATAAAVLAPHAAIVTDSGVSRAFVLGPEKVVERLVALGPVHGGLVEIRSGLKAGERVVLNPDRRLTDGLEVAR
jgi:membrane fusion protein (multidrug efflux system)